MTQYSMTGFGRFQADEQDFSLVWEIKSVNSRYLDLKWRLPVFLRSREPVLEKIVREFATRGRVEVSLSLSLLSPELAGSSLNRGQARSMVRELQALAGELGVAYAVDLNRLLGISSLWEDPMSEPDPRLMKSLEQGLRGALADWNASREAEGRNMVADIAGRVERLRAWRDAIHELAPQIKEEKFESLRARVQSILERFAVEADETRLIQEMAVMSDRVDISEELTRLSSHLEQLNALLDNGAEAGKRLDFVLQECFREINTCGNKAQDSRIARLVVDFKTELEKCREQVQNLE